MFHEDGRIMPRYVVFEDGNRYQIDRVFDVLPRASLRAGGIGMRYTIEINNHQTYLFKESDRWFVEARI